MCGPPSALSMFCLALGTRNSCLELRPAMCRKAICLAFLCFLFLISKEKALTGPPLRIETGQVKLGELGSSEVFYYYYYHRFIHSYKHLLSTRY